MAVNSKVTTNEAKVVEETQDAPKEETKTSTAVAKVDSPRTVSAQLPKNGHRENLYEYEKFNVDGKDVFRMIKMTSQNVSFDDERSLKLPFPSMK